MKMNDVFPSNYMKQDDAKQPITATIRDVVQEEINGDHGKEMKPVMRFNGAVKPIILNKGNWSILSSMYGDDSDAWHGKTIELYVDPSVMYAGKRVGGIRVRLPIMGAFQSQSNGNGSAPAAAAWKISDGKSVETRASADEVRAYLMELLELGIAPATRNIKGPDGKVLDGAAWMLAHAPAPADDQIPF